MNRRSFLTAAGLGAAGAGAYGLWSHRSPSTHVFGDAPEGARGAMVARGLQAENVLEVYLYGGVSQFESFYCVPEHGAEDGTGWSLFLKSGDVQAALSSCGVVGELTTPFARDANGQMVHFGPFAMPLRNRPDVMARTRIAITAHDLEPHEAAVPLALAGRRLGDASLAGLGSHIQRYFLERNRIQGRAPFSYILRPRSPGFPTDNVNAATAIGLHPGAVRPLQVLIDGAGDLGTALARGTVGDHAAAYDAAMRHYIEAYGSRLAWREPGGAGATMLRAPRVTDFSAGAEAIAGSRALQEVLATSYFDPQKATMCGDSNTDSTAMSLKLATHLLTHPVAPARYVCVIDGGLVMADGGGGYDSHKENSHTQARNLGHMLTTLMGLINKPGENDPQKLDLDRTMILLTTEFGRSPAAQDKGKGRKHWPYGFPNTFIGGPVRTPGVFGACGADSRATLASSPQENRIAALLALGIWPFEPESYRVADVPTAATHIAAAELVKRRQLGLT